MKAGKYILKYNLVFVFFIIILLPVTNDFFEIVKFERKSENRTFRDSLEIDINHLDRFPVECDEFVNDNFSFRRPLLDFYHNMEFYSFKVSPHPNKTIIGDDGWYFKAGEEMDMFEGKVTFSKRDLKLFVREWEYRKNYLDSLNIKYYWIIAPIKQRIYPEYLPLSIRLSSQNKTFITDQLKNALQSEFPDLIIDPTPELISAKNTKKVYYQLDNHWNLQAGYLVSELLLSRIKKDFPDSELGEIPRYKWRDSIIHNGFHYHVLGIEELSEAVTYPVIENESAKNFKKYGFKAPETFPYKWGYEERFINRKIKKGLRILFIRDSFGKQLIPFIKEPFKESIFIFDNWKYNLNKSIIEKTKPDIVVFLSLETHIDNIIIGK